MKASETLLFVDTNVLLDFYRIRSDASLALLGHLESLKNQLVITSQVEMEFKKNRQVAMLEGLQNLKPPPALSLPAIMRESKKTLAAQRKIKEAERLVKEAKDKLAKIIGDPIKHDEVFQAVQRLFVHVCPFNLTRENDDRFAVRRRALKRFVLGYPPRKNGDTSIGDAVNWEWMLQCAKERRGGQTSDLMIVSRDSDYGVTVGDQSFVNDQLQREFKDRVSRKRAVILETKLADALKRMQVSITKSEAEAEAVIAKPAVADTEGESQRKLRQFLMDLRDRLDKTGPWDFWQGSTGHADIKPDPPNTQP